MRELPKTALVLLGTYKDIILALGYSELKLIFSHPSRCCRSFLAGRVAYTLGTTGPCYILDTACSSSMFALDAAYRSIRSGECDAALIGGCNLVLHPYVTLQFAK